MRQECKGCSTIFDVAYKAGKDDSIIRCYTCKHRRHISGDYDPYCEANCGDAWQGYEEEEDGEDD